MLLGLVMVYSNTAVACRLSLVDNDRLVKQVVWVAVSLAALTACAFIDYHWLAKHSRLVLLLTFGALLAVLAFGTPVNGARRWFQVGPANLQVSEFAKIAVILYVASFVSRKREVLGSFWQGFVPPLMMVGITFGLIFIEPDFGTATLIAAVALALLVVAGVRWRHVLPLVTITLPVLFFLLKMKEYRWRRMVAFLDPMADPQGTGYHVVQSMIALACGGLAGQGPGAGLQKLGFLPESETDFVFAIIGQETGFIGCILLIAIFVVLFYTGVRIARAAPDVLGSLLALGVTLLIGFQMIINIGVATSAMPTKGISLPFVSYGGSSLLALSIGVGLLLNVAGHCVREAPIRVRGARRKEALEAA